MPTLTIFLHGIGSSSDTWSDFVNVLKSDKDTNSTLQYIPNSTIVNEDANYYYLYDYKSKILGMGKIVNKVRESISGNKVNGNITLDNHVKSLKSFISINAKSFSSINIVAHSMGGIVAMKLLLNLKGDVKLSGKIQRVILYGVPLKGSNEPNELKKILGKNIPTNILKELSPESITITSLNQGIEQEKEYLRNCFEILYIKGDSDNRIVEIEDDYFEKIGGIENVQGGHSEIVNPGNINSQSFILFKSFFFETRKNVVKVEENLKKSVDFYTPPFEIEDFKYDISDFPFYDDQYAEIPCVIGKNKYDDAIDAIHVALSNYYEMRSESIYQDHLELWEKSEKRSNGYNITITKERLERYEELKEKYKTKYHPLKFLISGETGAGKSTLVNSLSKTFNSSVINLEAEVDFSIDFVSFLNSRIINPKVHSTKNKAKIIFFDAFEKIRPGSTRKEIREQVKSISEVTKDYHCVVISIRSNFLLNYIDEGFSPYKLIEICSLEKKSMQLLAKKVGGNHDFFKVVSSSLTLSELARKPLLFSLLANYYLDEGDLKLVNSRYDLFEYIVDKWLMRDEGSSPISSGARLLITKRLAIYCLGRGKNSFSYEDINKALDDQFTKLSKKAIERYNNSIRSCSFIRHNDDGDFEFQHASFLEYCIARAIVDDMILSDYSSFSWESFNQEIIENIHQLLLRFKLVKIVKKSIVKAFSDAPNSRQRANILKLATALEIKSLPLDGLVLEDEVLTGINISNNEISGATFVNCDFSGANLAKIIARNWKLNNCILKGCNLDHVLINNSKIEGTVVSVLKDECLHFNYADCSGIEFVVDHKGLLEFTGGKINEGIIETNKINTDKLSSSKKSSIKFTTLNRVMFSEYAAGFYVGFCSCDELTLYSLFNLKSDFKPSLSDDIEKACKKWKGGASNVKKLVSPFARDENTSKTEDLISNVLNKNQMKKRKKIIENRKKRGY